MATEDKVTLDSRSPYFTDNIVASVNQQVMGKANQTLNNQLKRKKSKHYGQVQRSHSNIRPTIREGLLTKVQRDQRINISNIYGANIRPEIPQQPFQNMDALPLVGDIQPNTDNLLEQHLVQSQQLEGMGPNDFSAMSISPSVG